MTERGNGGGGRREGEIEGRREGCVEGNGWKRRGGVGWKGTGERRRDEVGGSITRIFEKAAWRARQSERMKCFCTSKCVCARVLRRAEKRGSQKSEENCEE